MADKNVQLHDSNGDDLFPLTKLGNITDFAGIFAYKTINTSITVPANATKDCGYVDPPSGYELLSCAVHTTAWEVVAHLSLYNSRPVVALANVSTSSKTITATGRVWYIKTGVI